MQLGATPTTERMFDERSWNDGFQRGFREGLWQGSYDERRKVLRQLEIWGRDLRLGFPDVATPLDAFKAIRLLLEPPKVTSMARAEGAWP
jgi:hypothetical protein